MKVRVLTLQYSEGLGGFPEEISIADEAGETPATPSEPTEGEEKKKEPLEGRGEFE